MKRMLMLALAFVLLAGAPAAAAPAIDEVDGSLGVSLGWFQVDNDTDTDPALGAASIDFDAALSFGLDYNFYVEEGTRAWKVAFLYTSPDAEGTGALAGWNGDATLWQLSANHLWYLSTMDAGPRKGWYVGAGLGYSKLDVDLTNAAGTTASADDTTLDINALAGYDFPCGATVGMQWVVDESNLGLSAGYRF